MYLLSSYVSFMDLGEQRSVVLSMEEFSWSARATHEPFVTFAPCSLSLLLAIPCWAGISSNFETSKRPYLCMNLPPKD